MPIVYKAKGFEFPEQFLAKAREGLRTIGVAAAIEDRVGVTAQSFDTPLDDDDWKVVLEGIKDTDAVFYFGYNEQPLEDIPPYHILTDKHNDQEYATLVAFAEGEFTGFVKPESIHSAAYFAIMDELAPQIQSVALMASGNIPKIMEGLHSPPWQKSISKLWTTKGAVVLVGANGSVQLTDSGMDIKSFDWGWTTESFGYGEAEYPPKEDPKPEEKKQTLVGGFLSKIKGTPKPEAKTEPATVVDQTVGDKVVKVAEGPPSQTNNWGHPDDTNLWNVPPEAFRKDHKRTKDWYRLNSADGKCHPDWKQFVAIRTKHKRTKDDATKAMDTAPGAYRSFEDAGEAIKAKDTAPHHIPTVPAAAGSPLKVAIRDVSSRAITDPTKWAEAETKVPDVAQREAFNFEDTFRWSIADIKMLAKDHPDFMAELYHNTRQRYMGMLSTSKQPAKTADGKLVSGSSFVPSKKAAGLPM